VLIDDPGIQAELLCFARLVLAARGEQSTLSGGPGAGASLTLTPREAGAASATDGSDPEPDSVKAAGQGSRGGSGSAAGGEAVAGSGAGAAGASGAEGEGEVTMEEELAVPTVVEDVWGGAESVLEELPSEEDAYRIRQACQQATSQPASK